MADSQQKFITGTLTIVMIALGVFYVQYENVQYRIDEDKSVFYIDKKIVGEEYNSLYLGTKKLYRNTSSITVEYIDSELYAEIVRYTGYKGTDAYIIDRWLFLKDTQSIIQFPVLHKIEVYNAQGLFYRYDVKRLPYSGETFRFSGDKISHDFDKDVKVTWWKDYNFGWIYSNGNMYVKSDKILTDYVEYDVRLYDPPTTLTVAGYSANIEAELGSTINVTSRGTGVICIDVNHTDYGVNYSCGTTATSFNLIINNTRKDKLNNSKKFNLTYASLSNKTVYLSAHAFDEVDNMTLNLTGFNTGSGYPADVKIYVNNTLSNSFDYVGTGTITTSTFNDSTTAKNVTFDEAETNIIGYLRLPKEATISGARFSVKGYGNQLFRLHETPNATSFAVAGLWSDPSSNLVDANYGTYALPVSGQTVWGIFNYNKTNPEIAGGYFRYKYGETGHFRNFSIPNECYDYNPNFIKVQVRTRRVTTGGYHNITCWDGSSYRSIHYTGYNYSSSGFSRMYEEAYWAKMPKTQNPWIEIGLVNGTRDWSRSGYYNLTQTTNDTKSRIQSYLTDCSEDESGYCNVPIYVSSDREGVIQISSISINYTFAVNPIQLNYNLIQAYLNKSTGYVNVPIKFENSVASKLEISGIGYDYAGGNNTIKVFAHSPGNVSGLTRVIRYFYSNWNYSYPGTVQYMEFIPKTQTSKNVTPYGQTTTRPILNITMKNYGGKANYSISLNETYSCVNMTIGTTSSKSAGTKMTTSNYVKFKSNQYSGTKFGVWMWADYQCNNTGWRVWQPELNFKACCSICEVCV